MRWAQVLVAVIVILALVPSFAVRFGDDHTYQLGRADHVPAFPVGFEPIDNVPTHPPGTKWEPSPIDWDDLAACEAGGNWSTDAFHDGGLQFHPETWRGYGGEEYAPHAHQATREQQIVIARRVLASEGAGAWPTCARRLGYLR